MTLVKNSVNAQEILDSGLIEVDIIRQDNIAYEYLCHLEETKIWLESCLKMILPPVMELEDRLRNGVLLAKLGNFIAPLVVPISCIYDRDERRYKLAGLQYRHTDNINYWLKSLNAVNLPKIFHPETTDVYDKKNMPKVIYCLHALSTHLFKRGEAPLIQDLYGKINFSAETITATRKELAESGVELPKFQKIAGLLLDDVKGNPITLHDIVISINNAIVSKDMNNFTKCLTNKMANLQFINLDYIENYLVVLRHAKQTKENSTMNKSLSESFEPDTYDDILTLNEIQGYISSVNIDQKWNEIFKAESDNDIVNVLKSKYIMLMDFNEKNSKYYELEFRNHSNAINSSNLNSIDKKCFLQRIVHGGNQLALMNKKQESFIKKLNNTLVIDDMNGFATLLREPILNINHLIKEFAIPLYFEELKDDRNDVNQDLSYNDIIQSLQVLNPIADVTKAVLSENIDMTWDRLSKLKKFFPDQELDAGLKLQYWSALDACRQFKIRSKGSFGILTFMNIKDCVDIVHNQLEQNKEIICILQNLNDALKSQNFNVVKQCITNSALQLECSVKAKDLQYIYELLLNRQNDSEEGVELWKDDVEDVIKRVNDEVDSIKKSSKWLLSVNLSLINNEKLSVFENLLKLVPMIEIEQQECFVTLLHLAKSKSKHRGSWITHETPYGRSVYLNLDSFDYSWEKPEFIPIPKYINMEEIQTTIMNMKKSYQHRKDTEELVNIIIQLQARIRGYLVRQELKKVQICNKKTLFAVKIQKWWRCILFKKQWSIFMIEVRKYLKPSQRVYTSFDIICITLVQALWRGKMVRKNFYHLFHTENPPYKIVKHFARLLNFNLEDYRREIELQNHRSQITKLIHQSNEMSHKADELDIKIGLLIQNRISLQDVIGHKNKNTEDINRIQQLNNLQNSINLMSLNKNSKHLLECYQNLFYMLQTKPHYLSKLIFCLPYSVRHISKFLEQTLMSIFNAGSNSRDAYFMLKLLALTLKEEIKLNCTKAAEIKTSNLNVLKAIVDQARCFDNQKRLKTIFKSVVEKLIDHRNTLFIDTNPVTIYRSWRNELETNTGEISDLPSSVDQHTALTYEEVQKRLNHNLEQLQTVTEEFLNKILDSKPLIPYTILYTARILRETIQELFPDTRENEIYKIIGYFVYNLYMNPAIITPEIYGIFETKIEEGISYRQRHNLASVAKILQYASNKKGYKEEIHLKCMNPFILDCYNKLKLFFNNCCNVDDPEVYYNMNEFTDVTLLTKPTINITLQEIQETHSLLLDNIDQVAPDPFDPIHQLLDELGPSAPTISQLYGSDDEDVMVQRRIATVQVCLTLSDKFEPNCKIASVTKLFIKTKELLIRVLPYLSGHTLPGALRIDSSLNEELQFSNRETKLNASGKSIDTAPVTLKDIKAKLRKNLKILEEEGVVSKDDGYQGIITSVAKDICNRNKYRQIQIKELQMVKSTKQRLDDKIKYLNEKIISYEQYIQTCLDKHNTGQKKSKSSSKTPRSKQLKTKKSVRYTAAKLREKGILIEVEGLPESQFKNAQFEIIPTDDHGIFMVKGKFMGVEMETVNIDIQDLLQRQFEGATIMDIFGTAKVNVNLLLFLLNKKFYCKT
ncbi:ras GTPase-activating-like protein IQGAP1 [Daktulosphaira vitifoliae]|uniref:ras GTPase-activating-like protein IQGAP1 n=1 Tax=Daktulosphaira vitifoliae TaxID=58002 RepID=UPI0021AA07D9|nr:ras GTPase-activating-like protein IQGAP1 [Daktulosphaira vitifoliae]